MKKFALSMTLGLVVFGLLVLVKLQPGGGKATATLGTTSSPGPSVSANPSTTSTTSPVTPAPTTGAFKDGTYKGTTVDNGYGPVQVAAVINGGKLSTVKILQVPSDRRSMEIASYSTPTLIKEAVTAQSSNINYVSGATATSEAFMQSLQSALSTAKS